MPLLLKGFLSWDMETRMAAVLRGRLKSGGPGPRAAALDGQPLALLGPTPVDDRPSALGPHPDQKPVSLFPLPVIRLKRPLHFSCLSLESKIELRIVGMTSYLVKKIGLVLFRFSFALPYMREWSEKLNSIENRLALC